jgi:hypothetical protein
MIQYNIELHNFPCLLTLPAQLNKWVLMGWLYTIQGGGNKYGQNPSEEAYRDQQCRKPQSRRGNNIVMCEWLLMGFGLVSEADHSPPSSAEVKNGGARPPLPHMSSWHSAY